MADLTHLGGGNKAPKTGLPATQPVGVQGTAKPKLGVAPPSPLGGNTLTPNDRHPNALPDFKIPPATAPKQEGGVPSLLHKDDIEDVHDWRNGRFKDLRNTPRALNAAAASARLDEEEHIASLEPWVNPKKAKPAVVQPKPAVVQPKPAAKPPIAPIPANKVKQVGPGTTSVNTGDISTQGAMDYFNRMLGEKRNREAEKENPMVKYFSRRKDGSYSANF